MDTISLYLKSSQLLGEFNVDTYVLARDQLCEVIFREKPICVILNTLDVKDKRFGHWVGIYYFKVDGAWKSEIFDSYGEPADKYRINPCMPVIRENRIELQSDDSELCGVWSLLYLFYRCKGKSLKDFQQLFTEEPRLNDSKLVRMYRAEISRVGAKNVKCLSGGQRCSAKHKVYT